MNMVEQMAHIWEKQWFFSSATLCMQRKVLAKGLSAYEVWILSAIDVTPLVFH